MAWRVLRWCCNVLQYKKGDLRVATGWRNCRGFPAAAVELLLPAGRVRASAARRRGSPPQRSDGSRVSRVGRRAGLRAVPQSGSARSLLQVSRWSSMELALAGRDQVSVGDCSVIGWGKMFGTGGARRMLSRMFGGEDAGLSLGDLSGGARAFQPGHAAKFAQGPRGSGSDGARGVPARPQPNVSPQRLVIAASQFDRRRKKRSQRAGESQPTRDPRHPLPPTRQEHHRLPHHKRMTCAPRRTAPARQPHRLPRPHQTAANRTNSAHAAASPPDSAEPANPAATTPRNQTRNRPDAAPAASPGPSRNGFPNADPSHPAQRRPTYTTD